MVLEIRPRSVVLRQLTSCVVSESATIDAKLLGDWQAMGDTGSGRILWIVRPGRQHDPLNFESGVLFLGLALLIAQRDAMIS